MASVFLLDRNLLFGSKCKWSVFWKTGPWIPALFSDLSVQREPGPVPGADMVPARASYWRPSGTPAASVHVGESGVGGTVWSLSWAGKRRQVSRRRPAGAGHFES